MSSIEKLKFQEPFIDRKNYLSWTFDVKAHLEANVILNTMENDEVKITLEKKAQALVFIRHHLANHLKMQYLNQFNP